MDNEVIWHDFRPLVQPARASIDEDRAAAFEVPVRPNRSRFQMKGRIVVAAFIFLIAFVAPQHVQTQGQVRAIYVADFGGHRIVRINDMTGAGWVTLGSTGSGIQQFKYPVDVLLDASGRIYVSDSRNYRIVRVNNMSGVGWTAFGSRGEGDGQFGGDHGGISIFSPMQIFLDPTGRIYAADHGNSRIVRMNDMTGGEWSPLYFEGSGARADQFEAPNGIFVDTAGRIYVTDDLRDRIVRVNDVSGAGWIAFGNSGSGANQFKRPQGIFVDPMGRIYVADRDNDRIVRMNDMSGAGWVALSRQGENRFVDPPDVFVDRAGRIYVVDAWLDQIVRVDDMTGAGWVVLRGSGADRFMTPAGIFVDVGTP